MGFLKKITRPISRVLDKIVPNEIKPALPFLAAAAPFMAPGIMGAFGNSMLSRGLISGGLNLGSQLAQEGSDGDFSGLSTLMAAATGALSTPGSAGGRTIGDTGKSYSQYMGGDSLASTGTQSAGDFFKNKALGMEPGLTKSGLGALETSSNYLTGVGDTLQNNLFSKEGLKAALIPAGQGMTDLAVAENRRALKAYEQDLADYEASMGDQATDEGRALAIRTAMLRYGFTEDEILDTISSAGYRAGGRVGLMMGGDPDFSGIKGAVMAVDENMMVDRSGDFFRLREEAIQKGDDDKIKEIESDYFREFNIVMPKMAKDGGLMNLGGREMDMRGGGFIPIGKKERADDVPARLSKNEFVMTADAVRAAGGGSVNEGAKRMYETMNRLEARA